MNSGIADLKSFENVIVEYIRDKGSNHRKGVLFAGIHPDEKDKVLVGFSLCCKKDKYDTVVAKDGTKTKVPGFGKAMAAKRALKWADSMIATTRSRKYHSPYTHLVFIPPSIYEDLVVFSSRIERYYKDAVVAPWLTRINRRLNGRESDTE